MNFQTRSRIGGKMFRIILWICPVVSLVCGAAIYGSALGYQVNMAYMGNVLMGVIFLVIGNYLPKCRQNYTVGIKLPWTLHDEDNWNKTHRVGGWCFMAAGVVMFFNVFLKASWLTFAVILLAALIPAIYSFLLYRKSTGGEL